MAAKAGGSVEQKGNRQRTRGSEAVNPAVAVNATANQQTKTTNPRGNDVPP